MVRLREVREELGLSQKDLSKASGVSMSTISMIETGKQKAHPSTLRKLADGMGVNIRELTRGPMVTFQMPSGMMGFMTAEQLKEFQRQHDS